MHATINKFSVQDAPQSRAVRRNVTGINAASSKHFVTKVAISYDIEQLMKTLKTNLGVLP